MATRKLKYKDRMITLPENPRTGKCAKCGRTDQRTNIHHKKYDDSDPLAHTIELCVGCHAKEHDFGVLGRKISKEIRHKSFLEKQAARQRKSYWKRKLASSEVKE